MRISFKPLTQDHFPLLLRWLETPHVKIWWDANLEWTLELISKKYQDYLRARNGIYAFCISIDDELIGYIQYYDKHDFPREHDYNLDLPESCAAIDWYIGDPDFLGRGLGTEALKIFLNQFVLPRFDNVFVDPDTANTKAIRAYEKVGFETIAQKNDLLKVTLMLMERPKQ